MEPRVNRKVKREIEIILPFVCPYCKTAQERTVYIDPRNDRPDYVWVFDQHSKECRINLMLNLMGYVAGSSDTCWNCKSGYVTSHEDHDWVRCKRVTGECWESPISNKTECTKAAVSPDGKCRLHERVGT